MIAVRDELVSAVRAVLMLGVMPNLTRKLVATVWVRIAHGNLVILNAVSFLMAEMAFVKVVDMAIMFDGRVAATGAVQMLMFGFL